MTTRTKPSVRRWLKSARTEWRKWAAGKSLAVRTRVQILCANYRWLERDPHDEVLGMAAARRVFEIAAVDGHYRRWDDEGRYVGPQEAA